MSTELQTPTPRRKTPPPATIAALAVVGVLVILVGTIWGTGGFGTDAKPFLGTRVEPGELVETRFWDVAVHGAEVDEGDGTIRVAITALNKQNRSSFTLTPGMVALRLPDGTPMLRGQCDSGHGGRFAPLIATDGVCSFSYVSEEIAKDSIPGPGSFDVEVIVRDQEIDDNLLTIPEPAPGDPAGWLPLTAQVLPEDES